MALEIEAAVMPAIRRLLETAYPEESAGLLLGNLLGETRRVTALFPCTNARETPARHNRYLIEARDMLRGEDEAERQGLEVLGVIHSHPDHPAQPSEFDRDWALPWYSYLIAQVTSGRIQALRAWRLAEDRSQFTEEAVIIDE